MVGVHAHRAAQLILERFGGDGKLEEFDGTWEVCSPAVETGNGGVKVRVALKEWEGLEGATGLDLDEIITFPRGAGLGTRVMEALKDYCEPRQVLLTLFALEGSGSFFAQFPWLMQDPASTRNFRSNWPVEHSVDT